MEFVHKSVLLDETVNGLNIKPDGIYVDGTLGGGGHAYEVCRRLGKQGSIVGIDQDEAAIEAAGFRLKDFGGEGYNSQEQLLQYEVKAPGIRH